MKYTFGFAFLLLAFAIFGMITHPGERAHNIAQTAPPASPALPSTVTSASIADTAAPAPDTPETLLIKAIQRSLADAQCYSGAIDGTWNGDTRQAMERVMTATGSSTSAAQPTAQLLDQLRTAVSLKSACAPSQDAVLAAPPVDPSVQAAAAPVPDASALTVTDPQQSVRSGKADSVFRHPLGTL